MSFPFNLYCAALLSGITVAAGSAAFWRRWCVRHGVIDDPGHRKIHDKPVPLAGGLAVLSGLAVPLIAGALILALAPAGWFFEVDSSAIRDGGKSIEWSPAVLLRYGLGERAVQLLGIIAGALGMFLVGWIDDRHELRPAPKFAAQLAIALAVAASGIRITLFVENELFSYAATVLWILTITNAFNFMDNMNGLCGGLGLIGAWLFALSAAAQDHYLVASFALLSCGALAGFLPFNFPNARMFLGDSGSHLVGFLMAVLAILPHFYSPENPNVLAVFTPLLVLAMPLIDLASVVVIRWRAGKPFYVGDTNHISHRLVRRGLSRTRAVLVIWIAAAVIGSLALL